MRHRIFGLLMTIAAAIILIVECVADAVPGEGGLLAIVCTLLAVPPGIFTAWCELRRTSPARNPDAPEHVHQPRVTHEGVTVAFHCQICGSRWSLAPRYLFIMLGAFAGANLILMVIMGLVGAAVLPDAKSMAMCMALILGFMLWAMCCIGWLVSWVAFLLIRGAKNPLHFMGRMRP